MPRISHCHFFALLLVRFSSRLDVATSTCSEDDCGACNTESDCDRYGCDSANDINGFRCYQGEGGNGTGCELYQIENCERDCEEEASSGFGFERDEEELDHCLSECQQNCQENSEMSPIMMLGVVAFCGVFSCSGSGIISITVTNSKLMKEKRKYYRENGDKIQGIVVGKESRYIQSNNGGHHVYSTTVDVQSEANGQIMRANKTFDVDSAMYNSVSQGSAVSVTSVAHITGDPRHIMLSAYAESDTRGAGSVGAAVCFGIIFAGVGAAASLGIAFGMLLPEDSVIGVAAIVVALVFLIVPIPLSSRLIKGRFEKEKNSPSGTTMQPRTDIEMANFQNMGQPIVLQPGMAGQPVTIQQQARVVMVQQPGTVVPVQQPVVLQAQLVAQQPQVIAQPTAVPVP